MIVDVHTHLPSHADKVPDSDLRIDSGMRSGQPVRMTNSIDDYLQAMAPVDKAFLLPVAQRPENADSERRRIPGWPKSMNINDVAVAVARRMPEKIIPFMSLHPLDPHVEAEYDRAVGDLGCKGIKMYPTQFDPESQKAFRLFARLEHDGLPLVFHQGTNPNWDASLSYAHPAVTDRVAMAFPRLKVVMAHLGHPWHIDCLAVARKHLNVWVDVSGQFYRPWSFWNGMRLFHEWGVTQKILFASDWPLSDPQDNIDGLRSLNKFAADYHLPGIPEKEIESIINRDTLDILGVD